MTFDSLKSRNFQSSIHAFYNYIASQEKLKALPTRFARGSQVKTLSESDYWTSLRVATGRFCEESVNNRSTTR